MMIIHPLHGTQTPALKLCWINSTIEDSIREPHKFVNTYSKSPISICITKNANDFFLWNENEVDEEKKVKKVKKSIVQNGGDMSKAETGQQENV